MNTFNLTLDLNKSRAANPVRIRQGDVQGTTITALILDHGATADLTGYTAQFVMDLPDGTHYYRKAASISGNTVTVTIDETQAASVTGRTTLAYVQLLKGSTVKASTGCVTVEVLPDALDGKAVPESYDSAIQEAIDALDDAVADLPSTVEDVLADHPEWTTTVTDGSISKAKLATDLARDRERLLYRLDNLLTNALPEGETATATDAAKTPVAGLALYGLSTQAGTPTPSAPVPIVSVEGANLMPPTVYNLATIESNPAYIYGGSSYRGVWCACEPNTTYTFTRDTMSGNRLGIATTTEAPAQNVTCTIVVSSVTALSRSKTFTTPADAKFVFVYLANDGSTITQDFALYRGSTAYPYVPYGHAGLWARGRNLLHGISASTSTNGVNRAFDASTGLLTMSGTATANNTDLSVALASPISVPEDTALTLSFENAASVPVSVYFNIFAHTTDGTYPEYHNTMAGKVTFTSLGGKTVDAFLFRVGPSTGALNFSTRVMVEYGSEATAYQPYEQTVTPIDLDGHELRSLPDGTRDELTVDARGHAVLVQRVGAATLVGIGNAGDEFDTTNGFTLYTKAMTMGLVGIDPAKARNANLRCDKLLPVPGNRQATNVMMVYASGLIVVNIAGSYASVTEARAALAAMGATVTYPLATPVTHDLGYVAAVPLVGPDLTAQAIPTAPMQLTYERDLNATLARLESAIADVATS